MSHTRWVSHNGKKILYVDYRGLKTAEEMIDTLDESVREELASPTRVFVLANFEGSFGSNKYMERVKQSGKEIGVQKVQKTALVGVTGMKEILLNAYLRFTAEKNMHVFDTEAEALDWLCQ